MVEKCFAQTFSTISKQYCCSFLSILHLLLTFKRLLRFLYHNRRNNSWQSSYIMFSFTTFLTLPVQLIVLLRSFVFFLFSNLWRDLCTIIIVRSTRPPYTLSTPTHVYEGAYTKEALKVTIELSKVCSFMS